MGDETHDLHVALEILGYLARHPEAADTEEHIRNWWLSSRDIEQAKEEVTSALQILEKNEYIEHVELPDRRIVYRLRNADPHQTWTLKQG